MKCITDSQQTKKLADILKNTDKTCWSLDELLDILYQVENVNNHKVQLIIGRCSCDRWFVCMERVNEENRCEVISTSEELIDACVDVILKTV